MKTIKKIFALILLFALLLSASAFLTSFRTKEPTPHLSDPLPLEPIPYIEFKTNLGSVVLSVDYSDVSAALSDRRATGKVELVIEVEVDGITHLIRTISDFYVEFDGKLPQEDLVIPAEYLTENRGELTVHCEIREFRDRAENAYRVHEYTDSRLYEKVPGTISLSLPKNENEQDNEPPSASGFGCAA